MTRPAKIDSTGNPGIPPPATLEAVVVVEVAVVRDVDVDAVMVVIRLVDVVTVETIVVVAVPVRSPPNGENRRIADSSPPGIPDGIVSNVLAEPTVHPLLGDIM